MTLYERIYSFNKIILRRLMNPERDSDVYNIEVSLSIIRETFSYHSTLFLSLISFYNVYYSKWSSL